MTHSADRLFISRVSSRTLPPPGNLRALRRAVAEHPSGAMLESLCDHFSFARYSIFAWDAVSLHVVPPDADQDPFFAIANLCRPWSSISAEPLQCDVQPRASRRAAGFATSRGLHARGAAQTPAPQTTPRPACLPFFGGWIGYLAYEAGRYVEPTAGWRSHPAPLPVSHWALFDTVLIHDRLLDAWHAAGLTLPPRLCPTDRPPLESRLDAVEQFLSALPLDEPPMLTVSHESSPGLPNLAPDEYFAAVRRILDYIRAGDVYQVNLARRLRFENSRPPIETYLRLCRSNPASHAAFINIQDPRGDAPPAAILSSSPELFLSVLGRGVLTRPIKGTRPRGPTPSADLAAEQALAASEKDRAELNMIIDLERNDLGRVCRFGSVRVVSPGRIERLPTVHHRAATVTGSLRDDADALDLLRAAFPGGSITGAPKVRAMQIINELEPDPRGPYCGAIGYIALSGDVQLNLAIRTLTVTERGIDLHVGSGIVADSAPEEEFAELQAKAAGMIAAVQLSHCEHIPGDDGQSDLLHAAAESCHA